MDKLGRNYKFSVQSVGGSTLLIELPFTIEFDITRNVLTSANVASIRIYNLNENHRGQIRKNLNDYGVKKLAELRAGYGSNLPIIFSGNISQAWSVREEINFITQIESFDGGFAFANSVTNSSLPEGSTQETVIDTFMKNLEAYGVQKGAIGSFPGSLSRSNSFSGNTTELLKEQTGGNFFIDNGKAYALNDNECLAGPVMLIDKNSGLLGTPVREQTILNFDMLFEPRLFIGQKIELKTNEKEKNFNGEYKIISLKHRGIISDAVCGSAITSVGMFAPLGSEELKTVVSE